jgi:uncharacterized protein (DUF305 family)
VGRPSSGYILHMLENRFRRYFASSALLALAACASAGPPKTVTVAPGSGIVTASAASATAIATADSAARAFAPADVEFMRGMVPHHAQAIQMSIIAAPNGARYDVIRLAERIIITQRDEIRMMRRWLTDRSQEAPDSMATRHRMRMNGAVHEMLMPGMLSDEEMAALTKARGAAFDRLYLLGMIRHHQGAIDMVKTLFSHGDAAHDDTVFRFASDVIADQSAEITRMQQMLETVPPSKD